MQRANRKQVLGNSPRPTTRRARQLAAEGVVGRTDIAPGMELYRAVRAAVVMRGQSFVQFCTEQAVDRSWAQQALTGGRDGKKAKALREQLVQAAGLHTDSIG